MVLRHWVKFISLLRPFGETRSLRPANDPPWCRPVRVHVRSESASAFHPGESTATESEPSSALTCPFFAESWLSCYSAYRGAFSRGQRISPNFPLCPGLDSSRLSRWPALIRQTVAAQRASISPQSWQFQGRGHPQPLGQRESIRLEQDKWML